jgi:hypothetical protein
MYISTQKVAPYSIMVDRAMSLSKDFVKHHIEPWWHNFSYRPWTLMLGQQRVRGKGRIEDAEEKEVEGNENNEEDKPEENEEKDGEDKDAEEKGEEDEDEEDRDQDQEGEDQEGGEGNKEHPPDYEQVDQLDEQPPMSLAWKDPGKAHGTKQRATTQKAPDTPSKKSKKSSGGLVSPTVPFFNQLTNQDYSCMTHHASIAARQPRSAKLTSSARLATGAVRRKSSTTKTSFQGMWCQRPKLLGPTLRNSPQLVLFKEHKPPPLPRQVPQPPPPPIPPPPLPTRLSVMVCSLP